jgi:hypothetical protein
MNEEQAQKLIEQNEVIIELLKQILSIAQGTTLLGKQLGC